MLILQVPSAMSNKVSKLVVIIALTELTAIQERHKLDVSLYTFQQWWDL